jgi:hypothetical protein
MRAAGPLEIPPGEQARLEPGGMHIMLMQLQGPLEEGEQIPPTLAFENASEITVNASIGGIGSEAAGVSRRRATPLRSTDRTWHLAGLQCAEMFMRASQRLRARPCS